MLKNIIAIIVVLVVMVFIIVVSIIITSVIFFRSLYSWRILPFLSLLSSLLSYVSCCLFSSLSLTLFFCISNLSILSSVFLPHSPLHFFLRLLPCLFPASTQRVLSVS